MNEKNIKALSELTFSDELFEKNSIEKMSNIPSRPSAFGESSLTPSQVKRRFDANANELRKKFNELLSLLPDLGGELKVDLPGITTLAALIYAINATEGTMLQDILSVSYGNDVIPLSTVVERLIKADGDNDTKIGKKLSLMSEIDAQRIKAYEETGAYYFSEANWEAFIGDEASGKFGYNRVYVERSKGRGSYGMYALSENAEPIYNAWYSKQEWAERFAAEHPGEEFREPYDIEYPLLDSIVQRQDDGNINVPLTPKNDRHAVPLKLLRETNDKIASTNDKIASMNDKIASTNDKIASMNDKIASMNDTIKGLQNELFAGTEGLAYTLSKDGTHYICTGLGDVPAGSDIELASYIYGVPVEEIGAEAFKDIEIASIRIPTTMKKYGKTAFGWSGPVGAVYIKDIAKWAASTFESSGTPVTAAHPKVYIKGIYRTDLVIPDGVTVINPRAFVHWVQFTSLKLPETVAAIQSMAFQYCSGLESVTIPASVKGIYGSAFGYCSGLKSVTFEGTPTHIESYAFQNCTALTDIYVPWGEGEVLGAPWGAMNANIHYPLVPTEGLAYELSTDGRIYTCTGIGSVTDTYIVIPDTIDNIPVTRIGANAFSNAGIETIILPRKLIIAYGGSLSSPTIKKVVVRTEESYFENVGPELFASWGYADYEGRPVHNNATSPFIPVEVVEDEWGLRLENTFGKNTTLEEIHVPWADDHPYMNNSAPWSCEVSAIHYKSEVK